MMSGVFREVCGRNIQDYAPGHRKDYQADLSLNENPIGCSEKVLKALRDINEEDVCRYHPVRESLKRKIAAYAGVGEENIAVSAGSDKCLQLLATAMFDLSTEVSYLSPSFPRYEFYTALMNASVNRIPYDPYRKPETARIISASRGSDVLILDTPSNPSGFEYNADIGEIVEEFSGTVVVDNALGDDSIEFGEYLHEGVVFTKSFSKFFGLPGLRIGYIVGSEESIRRIRALTSPFEVDYLSQIAAEAALGDERHRRKTREYVDRERERVKKRLKDMGVKHSDSSSMNLVARIERDVQRELGERGINFTAGENYKGLDEDSVRIGVRSYEENQLFLVALSRILR